jgi:hypothetical protein
MGRGFVSFTHAQDARGTPHVYEAPGTRHEARHQARSTATAIPIPPLTHSVANPRFA